MLTFLLAVAAALADVAGGLILVRAGAKERYLRYFVALGAGFMMAVAFMEMIPESLRVTGSALGPALVLAGYCIVHFIEHTITPHFHFGRETHDHELVSQHTGNSVLAGLAVHALFDGVAIGSGFALSSWLGWTIFVAIFLHKAPEGFTIASVMLASGRSPRLAVGSSVMLAAATVLGALVLSFVPRLVAVGMPLSAGVAVYVAATDLVPEVNHEPGIRMALVFFLGVAGFAALRFLFPNL